MLFIRVKNLNININFIEGTDKQTQLMETLIE